MAIMLDSAVKKTIEEKLAAEQNKKLQDSLVTRRACYVLLAALFILLSVGIGFTRFWMIALSSLVLGLICLSQYLDANGHLHEVRRRSTKTLVRDFSVLRRTEHESSKKAQSMTD
jgi:hypothetical protein